MASLKEYQVSNLRFPEDALSLPDDELGALVLQLFILAQAEDLGISIAEIPDDFGSLVIEHVLKLKANSAKLAPLEKVLHSAARGDFETAGRLLREDMIRGAIEIKFVPIGINRSRQSSEFGRRGAQANKAEGVANRQAVLDAARQILADRKKKPSQRKLAALIESQIGMSASTVRNHLRALREDGLLD